MKKIVRTRHKSLLGVLLQAGLFAIFVVTVVFNVVYITYDVKRHRKENDQGSNSFREQNMRQQESEVVVDKSFAGGQIEIEAQSGKTFVYVSVNGVRVFEDGLIDKSRGLHFVVLNQHNGRIVARRLFDTYNKVFGKQIKYFLDSLQDDRIVIMMTKDDASMRLKKVGREAIKDFGCKMVDKIKWRDTWVCIKMKGGDLIGENHRLNEKLETWAMPLRVQGVIKLLPKTKSCDYGVGKEADKRRSFCEKYDGYGRVCSCENFESLSLRPTSLKSYRASTLPIAVIASNRPVYLFRMLTKLLQVPGINPKMITIFIDDFMHKEPVDVARLLDLKVVQHSPECVQACRISQHYKKSLTETFNAFPDAPAMIILEEDLLVSDDILDYFSQTYPIFEKDSSVFCISAWNDHGYNHSVKDPSLLYRVENMPGLGWILKRSLYKEEWEQQWPDATFNWDWDVWTRTKKPRRGRECIIPDVSRTFHFGEQGLNVDEGFYEMHFASRPLNTKMNVKFDIEKMQKDNYEKEMHKLIRQAEVLNHTKNQCTHKDDFIPNTKGKTYVAYIHLDKTEPDLDEYFYDIDWYNTWLNLASCFNIWDINQRNFHNGAVRFWYKENHIIIIGVPWSVYSVHKPKNVTPIYMPSKKK
eukprot:Seg2928.6 transcript_id=Seg2928.6/GoldUCD/mRNA.D3Y31 product="Protein O-linked-mannose beta-1 2-N-acetylglucosaminyltransferase 1" protein_id=Seg2928.6/GoldUCD/D3Y31